jgi:hypothetical protein
MGGTFPSFYLLSSGLTIYSSKKKKKKKRKEKKKVVDKRLNFGFCILEAD